jgi:hypothetical protein
VRDLYQRKEELWARNGRSNLARQSDFHVIAGFFNMPHSCDMGQTALLPLLRKACRGFFIIRLSCTAQHKIKNAFGWIDGTVTIFESRDPKQQNWSPNRHFTVYCLYICPVIQVVVSLCYLYMRLTPYRVSSPSRQKPMFVLPI